MNTFKVSLFLVLSLGWLMSCTGDIEYDKKLMLSSKLKSKLRYYYMVIDSSKIDILYTSYTNAIDTIAKTKGEIKVVTERMTVTQDTVLIHFCTLSKRNNEDYITFITSQNGVITSKEYKQKWKMPDISSFCDAHYFYLPADTVSEDNYCVYSIYVDDEQVLDTKIFLSGKFDSFNNVICQCDSTELNNMISYINKSFRR